MRVPHLLYWSARGDYVIACDNVQQILPLRSVRRLRQLTELSGGR